MELWRKYGFKNKEDFYERYPNAPRKKNKRKRKVKRAIVRKGKIIAALEGMTQKYQLELMKVLAEIRVNLFSARLVRSVIMV